MTLTNPKESLMSKFQVLIATALTAMAGAAAAAESNYVGANAGLYNKYNLSCSAGVKCDKTASFGGKIYGGHNFGNFAVEGMAFTTNSAKGNVLKNGSNVAGDVRSRGLGVYGVLPLSFDAFTLKGKLGVGYVNSKAHYAAGGEVSKSSFAPIIGAGVSYAINKQLSLNGDWDQIRGKYSNEGKTRANMFSVGLSYAF